MDPIADGPVTWRPPSEADSLLLPVTRGCSWNRCTFCGMYRDRTFAVLPREEILAHLDRAARVLGETVRRVFLLDGDALAAPASLLLEVLAALRDRFPALRRVAAYASPATILAKSPGELRSLAEAGLWLLYLGVESGHDTVLRRCRKGATADDMVACAERCREAGIDLSVMILLGLGGRELSREHARASARVVSAMRPRYLSTLALVPVPGTPLAERIDRGEFTLPGPREMLAELREFLAAVEPGDARILFRANHASNPLPLAGTLPRDRERLLALLDAALADPSSPLFRLPLL